MLQLQEIFLNQFNLCRVGLKKPIKNNHDKFPNLFQCATQKTKETATQQR